MREQGNQFELSNKSPAQNSSISIESVVDITVCVNDQSDLSTVGRLTRGCHVRFGGRTKRFSITISYI